MANFIKTTDEDTYNKLKSEGLKFIGKMYGEYVFDNTEHNTNFSKEKVHCTNRLSI